MELPLLDMKDMITGRAYIGSKLVTSILKSMKFKPVEFACERGAHDIIMDEYFTYNDKFNSMQPDGKSTRYVLRSSNTKEKLLTCFEPQADRVQIRTLKQKLSDITTTYVIKNLTNDTYKHLFLAFYNPMSKLLNQYAKQKGLRVPEDICLFYKGGNVFRIILNDIISIMDSEEHTNLLKRSDADFQIFINPTLRGYNAVREDVSLLVTYVLYNLKHYLRRSRALRVSSELDLLKQDYIAELIAADVQIRDVRMETSRKAVRKDFAIAKGPYQGKEYVILRTFADGIATGIDAGTPTTYFISRNTSLDFKRKDNLKAEFELIRFRRNFRMHISMKSGEEIMMDSPFELIDVSIPKGDDLGLKKMIDHAQKYTRLYKFNDKFCFRAPTVEYQLSDLHDLLFKQNEYPWHDIKYNKRITRYFLTIVVYEIVEKLHNRQSVAEALQDILASFQAFAEYLRCTMPPQCHMNARHARTHYMVKLYDEFKRLHVKVKNNKEETENLKQFARNMLDNFSKMISEVSRLATAFDRTKQQTLAAMYDKLYTKGDTDIL